MPNYYSTTTTIETNMVGVTFDTSTTNLASNMIVEAQNEINKWVSKRYNISIYQTTTAATTTGGAPPLLQSWTDRLAEGYMWIRMSRGGANAQFQTIGDKLIKDVKECLKALVENQVDLLDESGDAISELSNPDNVLSNTEDYHSTFDEDDPLNWSVDSDKLNDISDDRD